MRLFEQPLSLFDIEGSTADVATDTALLNEESEDESLDTEVELSEPEEEDNEVEVEDEPEEPVESPKDIHPFDRPSIKQLTDKYPDIFKTFPALKDMYFREAEYSKIFPTIDEAKEAIENNDAFTSIREDIFSGNGSKFISAIKDVDEKGLERFASNILPNLIKSHPTAFWRAANPLVEDICRNMFTKGAREKNEDLQNSARYLSEYFFGDVNVAEGKKTTVIKDEVAETDVSKEREAFENEKHQVFFGTVSTSASTGLRNLIDTDKLDPKGLFSPFIKGTIIDKIKSDVDSALGADKDHVRYMQSLWEKAKRNGRTEEDKSRIVSAYLARAKSLIPALRSRYVSEALGQKVRASEQKKEKISEISSRRESSSQGKPSSGRSNGYNPKTINYSKTSDEDLLNDNIVYK